VSSLSSLSDSEIVARIRAGETALFEILMRRHNQRVYRVARAVLKDETEAEDAMQQAYINAFRHLNQFAERAQFATWLRESPCTKRSQGAANAPLRRRARRRMGPPPETSWICWRHVNRILNDKRIRQSSAVCCNPLSMACPRRIGPFSCCVRSKG